MAKITHSAGGVVMNPNGDVLVVNQNNNSWSLPKGHIDAGEGPLEAAKREIFEEAGVRNLLLAAELGVYQRPRISRDGRGDDPAEIKAICMYLFTTKEMDLKPQDSHHPVALWVDPEKVAEKLTHPKDKEFFLGVLDKVRSLKTKL